jgi:hypothetical protein
MAKIGRNDLCPCGSGKKHKKCCLLAEDSHPWTVEPSALVACNARSSQLDDDRMDELNERADNILKTLLDGRVAEAEALSHDFLRDFPGEAEGLDLLSMICERRGQRERALELLRQASNIAHARPDYDAETRALMRQRIKELEVPPWRSRRPTPEPGSRRSC